MNIEELNKEFIKIKTIIPEIEKNSGNQIKNLNKNLRKKILNIKVIPSLTSGGLESCETILKYLYWAEYLIEKELKKRTGFFDEKKSVALKKNKPIIDIELKNPSPDKFPFQHSSLNPRRGLPSPMKPRLEIPQKVGFMQKIISGLPAEKKNNIIKKETALTFKNNLPIKPITKNLYKKIEITPVEPKTIDFGPFYDKNKEKDEQL